MGIVGRGGIQERQVMLKRGGGVAEGGRECGTGVFIFGSGKEVVLSGDSDNSET